MKNKKLLTVAMIAGLTFGGLSVASVASAQGDGGDADTTQEADNTGADTTGAIVEVQDEADEAETEDGTAEDRQNEGRPGHRGGCNLDTAAEADHLRRWYSEQGYRFIEYTLWDSSNYRSAVLSKVLIRSNDLSDQASAPSRMLRFKTQIATPGVISPGPRNVV